MIRYHKKKRERNEKKRRKRKEKSAKACKKKGRIKQQRLRDTIGEHF
jgi:hypothetical protein